MLRADQMGLRPARTLVARLVRRCDSGAEQASTACAQAVPTAAPGPHPPARGGAPAAEARQGAGCGSSSSSRCSSSSSSSSSGSSSSSSSSSCGSYCCCWCVLTQTLLLQAFEADDESLTLDQLLQAARAAPPPKPPPEPAPATPPHRPTRTVSGERARLCYEASRAANNSVGVGGASPSGGGSDALGLALDPRTLGPQDRVRSSGASPASTVGGSSHSSKC